MKELNFENQLSEEIETSNYIYNLKEELGQTIKVLLFMSIIGVLIYIFVIYSALLSACFGFFGTGIGILIVELFQSHKIKKSKKNSKNNLIALSKQLAKHGLDVDVKSLQKSLITKTTSKTESINRKNELTVNEEIIERFYILDEAEQVKVLQETLRSCKSPDGSYTEIRKLFLLEDEDLKTIEMPSIVKNLKFVNSGKSNNNKNVTI